MRLKYITSILIVTLIITMLSACTSAGTTSQEAMPTASSSKYGTVQVYVTDAPPDEEVTEVLITVSGMEIHRADEEQEEEQSEGEGATPQQQEQTSEDQGRWIPIDISDDMKTFDLIQVKDIEEFFGEAKVEEGKYTQLRLSVIKAEVTTSDEITREARVPSNVIKIVRPFEVNAEETTTILLDFDAERSVVFTGSGDIQVKPVVKLSVNGEQQPGTSEENGDDEIVEDETTVEITCEEFNAENHLTSDVIVPVDSQLVVSLCSNASTGFAWSEAAEIGDTAILEQVQHEYIAPQPQNGEEPPPGTPGKEEWTFDTLSPGTTSVSFEYSQPWEGGEKGVWSLEIMLIVE